MLSETEMSVEYLEDKIKDKPNSLLFSRLADSYRKSGDVQKAISISIKGLETHPNYITGRIILGRCYLEQENFNDAIKEFTSVCKLDRRNQIAIKMLADVFSKQGMEEKAGDLYHILLNMDPENASLIHLAEVFSGTGRNNVFEILGVEDEIMVSHPSEEKPKASTEMVAEDDAKGKVQAGEIPEQSAEEPEAVLEEQDKAQADQIDDSAGQAEIESTTEDVKDRGEDKLSDQVETGDIQEETVDATDSISEEKDEAKPDSGDMKEEPEELKIISEADEEPDSLPEEENSINEILSPETVDSEEVSKQDMPTEEAEESQEKIETVSEEEKPSPETEAEKGPDKGEQELKELLFPESVDQGEKTEISALKESEKEKPDEEEAAIEDISDRMSTMFADEAAEPEIHVIESEDTKAESEKIPEIPDSKEISDLPELEEEDSESPVDELSSRVEDMFSDEGVQEESVADLDEIKEKDDISETPADIDVLEREEPDSKEAEETLVTVSSDRIESDRPSPENEVINEADSDLAEPGAPEVSTVTDTPLIPDGPKELETTQEEESKIAKPSEAIEETIEESVEEPEDTAIESEKDEVERLEVLLQEDVESLGGIVEEGKVSDVENIEPGLMDVEEMETSPEEELPDEQELSKASTELFEIGESQPVEMPEESHERGELPGSFEQDSTEERLSAVEGETKDNEEISEKTHTLEVTDLIDDDLPEKLTSAKESLEEVSEDLVSDATAVFDRDMIGRIASSLNNEQSVTAESPDSKEVVSRLDEIFNDENEEKGLSDDSNQESEVVREEELPSGKEFASHIEDIFPEKGDLPEETSMETLPDDDTSSEELVNEFYNESGDTVLLEDEIISPEKEMEVENEDAAGGEVSLAGIRDEEDTLDIVEEDVIFDNMNVESISEEEEEAAISDFYSENGEGAVDTGTEPEEINLEREVKDLKSDEVLESLPKEDVLNSMDTMFADDELVEDVSSDIVPDDEAEVDTVSADEFYTVSGEGAATEQEVTDTEPALEDETTTELVEEETEISDSDFLMEEEPEKAPLVKDDELLTKSDSIPDHVLTPTLADIYYQQGQLYLANQIYRRLLERDPDNDKVADRIAEIEQAIKEKELLAEKSDKPSNPGRKGKGRKTKSKVGGLKGDKRPLKGVKIKKKHKERIRKIKTKGK